MKKALFLFALTFTGTIAVFAQKKANGTVYIEHPAINVVDEFIKATVSGDEARINSFLTDDFRSFNGVSNAYGDSGATKKAFVANALRYHNEFDYFSIEPYPGSYPDAVEYKKDNKNDEVWVQTWDLLKGMHKATGVKLDAAAHRLYKLTKENKIKAIINYSNGSILDEIGVSFSNRTNGKIYNHHENINTVRKSMYAYEKGDFDKALSFFSDDARFYDINDEYRKYLNKTEAKADWQKFSNDFDIKFIEMIGYPDYLEYEMDNGREVLSWWKLHLVRKSDKKAIILPMHISDGFDENGKIISEIVYYSQSLLAK
ncbi:nuclear transport factor 2 family protein [Agriterribacter sp.]|uniref:nuclear transport factor 2 family protein n=1 Tax=Agriterribacter sp. TaxID=2821509 RepID=UPI002B94DAC5|nr:nuclear transport factor 2 family protein [Agriterribacter sp.]HRO46479.1 nuclear transport factor 2 family protein [Agriterribacter sp.]HRQ17378.1 nuclear transport factor 2 family protein [Agriterribacter sp.]